MGVLNINLRELIRQYANHKSEEGISLVENQDKNLIGLIRQEPRGVMKHASVDLLAYTWGHLFIIEHDENKPPFYETLLQLGIPREHIVLVYEGESVSEEKIVSMFYDLFLNELRVYSQHPLNGKSYLTSAKTSEGEMFAIITIPTATGRKYDAGAHLIVEWRPTYIIIHDDGNHPPFFESLLHVSIPRERIILAYAGETIPEVKSAS